MVYLSFSFNNIFNFFSIQSKKPGWAFNSSTVFSNPSTFNLKVLLLKFIILLSGILPNVKDSYVLYCKRINNSGKKERMMKEVEILFKNKPTVFCYNNIIDVCKPVWDFIQEEYLKYIK